MKKFFIALGAFLAIVVLMFGGLYAYSRMATPVAPSGVVHLGLPGTGPTSNGPGPKEVYAFISYDGKSFTPSTIKTTLGATVIFSAADGKSMWVASDPKDTRSAYSGKPASAHCPDTAGVAFDQCANGGKYAFVFTKKGMWTYHDHLNPSAVGSITVE